MIQTIDGKPSLLLDLNSPLRLLKELQISGYRYGYGYKLGPFFTNPSKLVDCSGYTEGAIR